MSIEQQTIAILRRLMAERDAALAALDRIRMPITDEDCTCDGEEDYVCAADPQGYHVCPWCRDHQPCPDGLLP